MKNQSNSRSMLQRLPALALAALVGLGAPALSAGEPEAPLPFPRHDPDGESPNSALPVLTRRVEPVGAAVTSTEGREACVHVAFVVDATGAVKNPRVMYACAPEAERAALAAIGQWQFTAGKLKGKAVATRMTVALRIPSAPKS